MAKLVNLKKHFIILATSKFTIISKSKVKIPKIVFPYVTD